MCLIPWFFMLLLAETPAVAGVSGEDGTVDVASFHWSFFARGIKHVRSVWDGFVQQWDPSARKVLVVSLSEQKMYLFRQRSLLAVFVVSTGRNNYTPKGRFRIYYKKDRVRYTSGEGMDYWMEFRRNYGVHGLPVDADGNETGAEELGTPASAGCVRLDTTQAHLLFRVVPTGSTIIIQDDPPRMDH